MRLQLSTLVLLAAGLGSQAASRPATRFPAPVRAERDSSFQLSDSVTGLLSFVSDLVLPGDGTVFLADEQLPSLLQLDSTGTLRRRLGRQGEGPGEFGRGVIILGLRGDSLWALDPSLQRITLFPRRGPGVGTIDFRRAATRAASGRAVVRWGMPQGLLSDGTLLVFESESEPGAPEASTQLMYRTTRQLEILDTLARLSDRRSGLVIPVGDGELNTGQPFSDDPRGSASDDGKLLFLVERPAADRPGPAHFRITARRADGTLVFDREIEYQPRRITESEVDSAVRRITRGIPGDRMPPIPEGPVRRALYRPAFWSPVNNLQVARDGTVWVALTSADGPRDGTDWLVLSPRGLPQGRVVTPAGFRVMAVDRSMLYGVEGGWGEVPTVVRYRVPRS